MNAPLNPIKKIVYRFENPIGPNYILFILQNFYFSFIQEFANVCAIDWKWTASKKNFVFFLEKCYVYNIIIIFSQ